MVCFQTKHPNLGKFWRALDWKMFIYFKATWNILWRFGIFYGHLVHFVFIWYIFSGFSIMYQEKSGNTGRGAQRSMFLPSLTFSADLGAGQKLLHMKTSTIF
jgi:hypothetical protein